MTFTTLLGLILVTGGSTLLGSTPVLFHRYFRESRWNWWESFGGGVMMSAALFSLYWPAIALKVSWTPILTGTAAGLLFIGVSAKVIGLLTQNLAHRKAFLYVFVMGLHNIPEGLSVGVDVAAVGWRESLPLCVSIFIQNLPEGFSSSLSFLISGFSVPKALAANGVTALIEMASALGGFEFASGSVASLPFMLSFAGASMITVVFREILHRRGEEAASFAWSGFLSGVVLVAMLDLIL